MCENGRENDFVFVHAETKKKTVIFFPLYEENRDNSFFSAIAYDMQSNTVFALLCFEREGVKHLQYLMLRPDGTKRVVLDITNP